MRVSGETVDDGGPIHTLQIFCEGQAMMDGLHATSSARHVIAPGAARARPRVCAERPQAAEDSW